MNGTTFLIGATLLLVILMAVWAKGRAARIRAESAARERRALAAVKAGGDPTTQDGEAATPPKPAESTGETIFEPGTPTSMVPGRAGSIEVAEVLDIEELLRDEPHGVASRARAQLEEPTNIHMGDTLPPRPVTPPPPAPPPPVAAPAAARAAVQAPARPAVQAPAHAGAKMPARPAVQTPARAAPAMQPAAQPVGAAPAPALAPRAPAATPPQMPARAPAAARAPAPARAAAPAQPPAPVAPDGEVPLRELVLAWFEARGYRSAPASPVVRPIELVLRHKDDPSRAYAFVVGTQRVTAERVQQLAQQARGIGLIRVLIVADAGLSADAPNAKRGVRVLDRGTLSAELAKLDISVAAKIIAVARKRASARATVS